MKEGGGVGGGWFEAVEPQDKVEVRNRRGGGCSRDSKARGGVSDGRIAGQQQTGRKTKRGGVGKEKNKKAAFDCGEKTLARGRKKKAYNYPDAHDR